MAADETRFRVMASDTQVLVVDGPPEAGDTARRALVDLELAWSRFIAGSDIDRLNRASTSGRPRPVPVTGATITLIDKMIEAYRITDGRFDPSLLAALVDAAPPFRIEHAHEPADFTPADNGSATQPFSLTDGALDRGAHTAILPAGLTLDPGGIGKGLAADLVVAKLLAGGADGALVSIGGDLAAAGTAPTSDGWLVEIEDPTVAARILGTVALSGGGVATSSTMSRRWSGPGGTTCHHVIDPRTGRPSSTDLAGVTVVASCGWRAEAAATALLLGGTAGLVEDARALGVEAVGTTSTGMTVSTTAFESLLDARTPT